MILMYLVVPSLALILKITRMQNYYWTKKKLQNFSVLLFNASKTTKGRKPQSVGKARGYVKHERY